MNHTLTDPDAIAVMRDMLLYGISTKYLDAMSREELKQWIAKRIEAFMPSAEELDALTTALQHAIAQERRDKAKPPDSPRKRGADRMYL